MIGEKFSRLTVISPLHKDKWGRQYFYCLCDCGNHKSVRIDHIQKGNIQSCGCRRNEVVKICNVTHGDSRSKEHITWKSIKFRCYNKNCKEYHYYGGRGIVMCERWRSSYLNFLADMGRAPSPKHSIDRINVNGNYEPNNCKWSTVKEQANNKRQYKNATKTA
jgi:hypothetical protein